MNIYISQADDGLLVCIDGRIASGLKEEEALWAVAQRLNGNVHRWLETPAQRDAKLQDTLRSIGVLPKKIDDSESTLAAALNTLSREIDRDVHAARESAEGWVTWGGGDNPVPGISIDVIRRSGIYSRQLSSNALRWSHEGSDYDIVKYRLLNHEIKK